MDAPVPFINEDDNIATQGIHEDDNIATQGTNEDDNPGGEPIVIDILGSTEVPLFEEVHGVDV
jgi:hypothetical protein